MKEGLEISSPLYKECGSSGYWENTIIFSTRNKEAIQERWMGKVINCFPGIKEKLDPLPHLLNLQTWKTMNCTSSRAASLNHGITDIWGQITLCAGGPSCALVAP